MLFGKKLKAGTPFKKSVMGHRRFVYPGNGTDTLIEDTAYTRQNYVGGGGNVAVSVSERAIKYDGVQDKNVIIWVEKSEIL